jgi:hypothetical protein
MPKRRVKMTPAENVLVEEINKMFDRKSLGLGAEPDGINDPSGMGVQYLHAQIDELFESRITALVHFDSIRSAFRKIHEYCHLTNQGFCRAFDRDMTSRGVPPTERAEACKLIPSIIKELASEEQDYGFNKSLDEIVDVSQPGIED